MPPKTKNTGSGLVWYLQENAYLFNTNIVVQYELQFKDDLIKPGNLIKIKNDRATYKFRCFAHNVVEDETWIDCMDVDRGSWHSFRIDKIKCLVKPKRSRRKKVNA